MLGWEPWHLSDIEREKVKPTRRELGQLFVVLQLADKDTAQGCFLAGIPPTEAERDEWTQQTEGFCADIDRPVIFRDFTGMLLNANSGARAIFPFASDIRRKRHQWLEVLFDRTLREIPGWDEQLQNHLTYFVADTPFDIRDDWYREVLIEMYKSPDFASFWTNALKEAEFNKQVLHGLRDVTMPAVVEGKIQLTPFTRISRQAYDPRFRADFYLPKAA